MSGVGEELEVPFGGASPDFRKGVSSCLWANPGRIEIGGVLIAPGLIFPAGGYCPLNSYFLTFPNRSFGNE
jgi:hypothetical protein